MPICYRPAELADIPALIEIRGAVRENRLVSVTLAQEDYARALAVEGRAWVACEADGRIVGFVCGRPARGDVWALFLRPSHEGRGIGGALMQIVEDWMFAAGLDEIHLATEPGTRADALYRRRGWLPGEILASGEVSFTLRRTR